MIYRAPGWSWAAIDGEIAAIRHENQYREDGRAGPHQDDSQAFRVCDVKFEYATEHTTGAITGGWLEVCGHIKSMSLRKPQTASTKPRRMLVDDEIIPLQHGDISGVFLDAPYASGRCFRH